MSPFLRPLALVAQPILCEREGLADRFAENGTGRNNVNHASDVEFARASKLRSDRIADTRQIQPTARFGQRLRVVGEDIDQRGAYSRTRAQPEDNGGPRYTISARQRVPKRIFVDPPRSSAHAAPASRSTAPGGREASTRCSAHHVTATRSLPGPETNRYTDGLKRWLRQTTCAR
jgi:hypothetical protein